MVLKGIYGASSKSGYSRILVGLAVSMVVMFAGLIPLLELFGGNEAVMWIWFAFSFSVPNIITRMIMNRISIKRKVKAFLNADNLAVNGATIVGINPAKGTILYIEDDFDNHDGRPVIIEYPALGSELNAEDIGKRLVVMYDSDTSFQLMKLNESLGGTYTGIIDRVCSVYRNYSIHSTYATYRQEKYRSSCSV